MRNEVASQLWNLLPDQQLPSNHADAALSFDRVEATPRESAKVRTFSQKRCNVSAHEHDANFKAWISGGFPATVVNSDISCNALDKA